MDGEIAPLAPLLNRVRIEGEADEKRKDASAGKRAPATPAPHPDARGLKVAPADIETFSERVIAAFRELARDYYLEPDVHLDVRVGKDAIRIVIPVAKDR